jgi:hypothetical protein
MTSPDVGEWTRGAEHRLDEGHEAARIAASAEGSGTSARLGHSLSGRLIRLFIEDPSRDPAGCNQGECAISHRRLSVLARICS